MKRAPGLLKLAVALGAILGLAVAVFLILPRISRAASNGMSLTGTVKSDSGEKMEGVTVSAKADGGTITTTVFTDDQGNYYFPSLPSGQYRVLAQAVGYETGRASAALGGAAQHQDFSLKTMKDFSRQMTGDQWMASLPEDTPQHRKMKEVFENNCVGCHPPNYTFLNRFDEAGWTAIINLMSKIGTEGNFGGPDLAPLAVPTYYKKQLASYLSEMRGPSAASMELKARPRPTGDGTLAVITEYDVEPDFTGGVGEVQNDGSDWSLGTPTEMDGNHGIHDATADLDGNIWFAYTEPSPDRTVARVDAVTGKITNIKVPGARGLAAGSHGITRDQNGMIWFNIRGDGMGGDQEGGGSGSLVRLDPKTEQFKVFTPPKGMGGVGGIMDVAPDGCIWVATNEGALHFDPKTEQFTEFKSVTQKSPLGSIGTYGATFDREGNGWWTQIAIDRVDKGNIKTGESQEILFPPAKSLSESMLTPEERKLYDLAGSNSAGGQIAPWVQAPRRMGGDPNADLVWVTDFYGNNVAKIDIHTLKPTFYPVPRPDAGPYDVAVDSNHMVYVDLLNSEQVDKLDPATGKWTQYNLPSLGAQTRHVGLLQRDGKTEVIVGYTRLSRVARLQFRTREELQALRTQAQQVARNQ